MIKQRRGILSSQNVTPKVWYKCKMTSGSPGAIDYYISKQSALDYLTIKSEVEIGTYALPID